MSFVYAVKGSIDYNGDIQEFTHIYSDTKVSLVGVCKDNWGDRTREIIEKFGLIKSIIVSPKCCVSFAGNNIAYASKLLHQLSEMKQFSEKELIDLAWEIHINALKDEIEFIICLADEKDRTEIICIKNNSIQRNCQSAWIGSSDAFEYLQKYRMQNDTYQEAYFQAFTYAMRCCTDDSVGGFCIGVIFSSLTHQFEYQERLETAVEREQIVLPGMPIKISGNAEEGAATIHYYSSDAGVEIQIDQTNLTIIYTSKYRLELSDCGNPKTMHFLLPIKIKTDSREVILP